MCDTTGALYKGRQERNEPLKEEIARLTNPRESRGPWPIPFRAGMSSSASPPAMS